MSLNVQIRHEDPSSTTVFSDGNAISLAARLNSILELPMPETQALHMIDRWLRAEYGARSVRTEGPRDLYKWVYDPTHELWVLMCCQKQIFSIDVDWEEPVVLDAEVGTEYQA